MSRRKLKSRMRRRRRQCNILVGAICIAVIIIAAAICGRAMKKDAKQTAGTSAIKEEKKSAKSKNLTINSNKSGKAKGKKVADRSDFAVQPGRKVGTTEQSDEKIVYFTLDDGPSQNTQKVLDILDKYNAKATFFVTGAMPEYKDMIKKAYDKGHTIGMHTYSHDYAVTV